MFNKLKLFSLETALEKQGFSLWFRAKNDVELIERLRRDIYSGNENGSGYRVSDNGRIHQNLEVYIHELNIDNVRDCTDRYLVYTKRINHKFR